METPTGKPIPMADSGAVGWAAEWSEELHSLGLRIRAAVRSAVEEARSQGPEARAALASAVGQGAGDVTFAIDEVAEREVTAWLEDVARARPLSLLTEDAGWRHLGPAPAGGSAPLDGFDHGGPRLVLDPIDGSRPLMHDLRPAWVVLAGAGPSSEAPRLAELDFGLVMEIPDSRGRAGRVLWATRGRGAFAREDDLGPQGASTSPISLSADDDPRADRGHFPFFSFTPTGRAQAQALASATFALVEGIDPSTVLDDQLCSSGGQLALLALGTYRVSVDARCSLNALHGTSIQTAKPYDIAGAVVVAREAGCVVEALDGSPLEMPMDTSTPVEFAGYHNAGTRNALAPALRTALETIAKDHGLKPEQ